MDELPAARILEIAERFGVSKVRVFGSRARGDETPTSDLDLLVRFSPGTSLFDLIRFERELEELLGMRVEAVSEKALHPVIKEQVLSEARPLVAA